MMYRIQLNDPRLNLPVPVYERPDATWSTERYGNALPRFFALPKSANGMVAIGLEEKTGRLVRLVKGTDAIFHVAFDPVALDQNYLLPLHEWTRVDQGQTIYDYDTKPPANGNWERSSTPLGHVWPLRRSISP